MDTAIKNDIIRAILSMPPIDRIEIIDKVIDDFNTDGTTDYESLWTEEAESRIDGYTNGSIPVHNAEDVFKKINNMIFIQGKL